jgi:LPS sulfotransferase NodH
MIPRLSYIICKNPRSGSWLLAECLRKTGIVGNPLEAFNLEPEGDNEANRCRRWGIPLPSESTYKKYLSKVIEEGTTDNGIFGMESMWDHFQVLPAKLSTIAAYNGLATPEIMRRAFPNLHYIRLIRRDKVRQAISYYRAVKSDIWRIENKNNLQSHKMPPVPFDPVAIMQWEQGFIEREARWENYFKESGQKPFVVFYEDLAANYEETIIRVLEYLHIPDARSIKIPPPQYKKLSDELTEDMVQRYLEYKRTQAPKPAAVQAAPPLTIPPVWKRWVAENKLIHIPDQDILPTLKRHHIDEKMAEEELRTIGDNPYFQAANSYTQLMHKRSSFALVERQLAALDPKNKTVERRSGVSRAEFLEKYYAANRPVILCDLMSKWKAMKRWTPEYFKATCGDTMVEIMVDRDKNPSYETEDSKHRQMVRFGDFVDRVAGSDGSNDCYLTARNKFFSNPEVRPLLKDLEIFPEYLDGKPDWMFLWYGPKNTVTPLHHDLMNIFMAQVQGRKRITLVPATEMELVYNNNGVYSPIDIEKPDYDLFPKFREANVMQVELEPGEVLFLPIGWWHHVRALDTSITVTFMNFLFPNHFTWMHPQAKR